MPVGFGFSVGDFIAALNLIHDAIEAIDSTHGSKAHFRGLTRELYLLESVLLRVKQLELEDSLEPEKRALEQAASQCQRAIDDFLIRVQTYQPHLQAGGSGDGSRARMQDAWSKIKWALCKKDDVEAFKLDLRGHSTSIQLLLQTVEMKNAMIRTRKDDWRFTSIMKRIQEVSNAVTCNAINISNDIHSCLQQGKKQLDITTQIMRTNLLMFNMVVNIHKLITNMPYQVQHDQPVYMVDAFGRLTPFHLEFIRSVECFLAVLRMNFAAAGVGTEKIDRREIAFEDTATKRDIDITSNWEFCFCPGQRISMSVVFESESRVVEGACPSCGAEQQGSCDIETECAICNLHFRRISACFKPARSILASNYISIRYPGGDFGASVMLERSTLDLASSAGPNPSVLDSIGPFRRVRLTPGVGSHACQLWTVFQNRRGKTLEGAGDIRIGNLNNGPTLELLGGEDAEPANAPIWIHDCSKSLEGYPLPFHLLGGKVIVLFCSIECPYHPPGTALMHFLEFKDSNWCKAVWTTLNQIVRPVGSNKRTE